MNELQTFTSTEFGSVRTIEINGEPWFIASDIAKALDYRMASDLTRRLEDEDKGTQKVSTLGGEQEMTVINESGLYTAILGSSLPKAKKFKHWLTSEVIPSIRKHGAYMTQETIEKALTSPDFLIQLATKLKDEQEKNKRLAAENEEMKPKAEFFDAVAESKDAIEIGEAAKVLHIAGIGRNKLFEILRDQKYLMQNNQPYQKYIDCGYFRTIEQKYTVPTGEVRISIKTLVYQKGLTAIRNLIVRDL